MLKRSYFFILFTTECMFNKMMQITPLYILQMLILNLL
jgi:hypothetical protein